MDFQGITLRLDADRPEDIARAAAILRSGGTVALPTETVYGLGANAFDADAVSGIFAAKQRPSWDPLIVHVTDAAMLREIAVVSAQAQRLIDAFWPGPLTLLLPRTAAIPDSVTAGRALVGVRMPAHPIALDLIAQAGVPVAAPSANRFGHTSPTTAQHVLDDLDGRIHAVLDGGATRVGVESTVVEIVEDGILVYRPGGLDFGALESLNDVGWVRMFVPEARDESPQSLPSPGVGIRHYAPRASLVLVGDVGAHALSRRLEPLGLALVKTIDQCVADGRKVGVMLPDGWNASAASLIYRWGAWGDGETLAQRLFAGLRELDELGAEVIVCPVPEMGGIGEALRDRLEKAARVA